MDAAEAIFLGRALLSHVTPLRSDCGKYCGAACCRGDESGKGGMLLFPGEENHYASLPESFSISSDDTVMPGMTLLTCQGFCRRDERPLACMFFPLIPLIEAVDGRERCVLRMDVRAGSVCPLTPYGLKGLSDSFVAAARETGKILCSSSGIRPYLIELERHLRGFRVF